VLRLGTVPWRRCPTLSAVGCALAATLAVCSSTSAATPAIPDGLPLAPGAHQDQVFTGLDPSLATALAPVGASVESRAG
jgi:hypothetical protein